MCEMMPLSPSVNIDLHYDQRVNCALQQNDVAVIKLLQVENAGEEDLNDLTATIWIEGGPQLCSLVCSRVFPMARKLHLPVF